MSDRRIRKVVILGGGTAGWMTAAALTKVNSPPQFEITLIESDDIGTIGVGEATIPTIHWFNRLVEVSEADLLRETKATFKLGIELTHWNGADQRYFHPFGFFGGPNDGPMFYHRWIRSRLEGGSESHYDYSLTAQAARAGKFAPPSPDPNSIFATLGHAYHFDAGLYAGLLRRRCEGRGVRRVEGKVTRVTQDPTSGFVTTLTTQRGEVIAGDLFIDCSGMRALLIEGTLNSGFEDWSHWLPADRALAVPSEVAADPSPFTRAIAHPRGWQWRIPLQHRTGNGIVYSSQFMDDATAADTLMSNLDGAALGPPRLIRFAAGQRKLAWNKNVIAIGLSAGFLEPLESTSIHLIQSGIAKLLSLFPTRDCDPQTAAQFNRIFAADVESIRDFLILHYHRTAGRSEPLWQYCQHMNIPEGLAYKSDLFRNTGRIVLGSEDLFKEASWFAVMMGQGLEPKDYNPLVDSISREENLAHLRRIRGQIATALMTMPRHRDYIQQRLKAA
jgi:tryptophan halogenase